MNYNLIKDVVQLVADFESSPFLSRYKNDLEGFKHWIYDNMKGQRGVAGEPDWEGKEKGRTPESVINTLLVHLNRYAKTYSKSAIYDSGFSTQEEFIYLINLKAFGAMSKMELIKKNIQEKPVGMQIINRLIKQGWVSQKNSETDKRSKTIQITDFGLEALEQQMQKIRKATQIVAGDLSHAEKMELIRLLNKLECFHHAIFSMNIESVDLLDAVVTNYLPSSS
jgi:DNA-binding MarR family transcriptional regulator